MGFELRFRVPGQLQETVPLTQSRTIIGTLMSNHVVLRAPDVEPIHAMVEEINDGQFVVTDLGSAAGVKVNGKPVEVESTLKIGDRIQVGTVEIIVHEAQPQMAVMEDTNVAARGPEDVVPPPPPFIPAAAPARSPTVPSAGADMRASTPPKTHAGEEKRQEKRDVLFNPRKARPSGDVLEVVAYWGDTVLDVDLFHPKIPGYERVTIGDPTKAHFIAAGEEEISSHRFVDVREDGYKLHLLKGMDARIRKNGVVESKSERGSVSMGRRDIAHIKYGAVRYFVLFVNPPAIDLPNSGPKDPFFAGLMAFSTFFYVMMMGALFVTAPKHEEEQKDDIWALVQLPEKDKPPVPVEKPKQPKVEIAEVKTPPPEKKPPPPAPKPVQPAKPIEVEKPKQTTPVEKPVPKPETKPTAALAEQKQAPEKAGDLSKLAKSTEGMASTGAKKPDFKLAGAQTNKPLGPSGGAQGSGMNQRGGAIKGNQKNSIKGVEGPKNNKASGINLDKLGFGVGKVLDKTGPSAMHTNFQSSVGGAGGGMGSGSKTYGMGGVGNSKSLGLAGASGAANNFGGGGSGGYLSGQGGTGGLGGAGMGKGFGGEGRGRANVTVPPGDPVVSGGLTPQEILAVIRANLNQIRHCYEQLLQRSPSASGKLSVRFVVGASGRVSSAVIESGDISDANMRGCVTGKITRWKFPEPRGGQAVTVNYPFVFNPL